MDDKTFLEDMSSRVQISSVSSSAKKPKIDPSTLARKWGIGLDVAQNTIRKTTQRGVRTVLHPTLSRRFRTNNRQLRYRRLRSNMFSDTLISSITSKDGNKYAQVFCTDYGWTRAFPMKRKSEAHEALSLLFSREGVPPVMVIDGSKEQVKGQFKRKLALADCHLRQIEPYSPWMNAAEGSIRELKRGAGRKMEKAGSPKKLWDHLLELEALIRSNTAHNIYQLKGEVPETMVSGETSDISLFLI